jgi:hypothetical protein
VGGQLGGSFWMLSGSACCTTSAHPRARQGRCRHSAREGPASLLQTRRHASNLGDDASWGPPAHTVHSPRRWRHRTGRTRTLPTLHGTTAFKPGPGANRDPDSTGRRLSCLGPAHHGLTTQVPHAVDIALPSHAQVPKIDGVPLRVFWYPESSFRAGVDLISVDDVPVKIYSPEKTIADCFKYRNKIGLDIAIEALRAYRECTRKPNRAALTKFAQIDRVQKLVRPYLEALL